MSELTAMPGPFVAERTGDDPEFWAIKQPGLSGDTVCYLSLQPEVGSLAGNAALLGAAHDLYEALDNLLDELDATPELNLSSWGIDTRYAIEALAKARGAA